MSNYRRLISYIYAYEGGVKGKNIGFAKLESRNGQCKISVSVKKIYVGGSDMGVFLLSGDEEIKLGTIFVRNGAGEFRTMVNANNVENSGETLDTCYGLSIHEVENAWRAYTTIWEDAVAHAAEIELGDAASQRSKEEQDTKVPVSVAAEIEQELQRESQMDERQVVQQQMQQESHQEKEAESLPECSQAEIQEVQKEESPAEPISPPVIEPIPSGEWQPDGIFRYISAEHLSFLQPKKENLPKENIPDEDSAKAELSMESEEVAQAAVQPVEQPAAQPILQSSMQSMPPLGDASKLEELSQMETEEDEKRQVWDFFKSQHAKIPAFDYQHGCEILTIKPQDIGMLPREAWVYGNNSFLLHGFYNYRYLILAKLENPQGHPRFLLGVPGHYYKNEKYMATMFGFPDFVLAKKQPSEDGRFGYWYTDVAVED